MTPPTPRRSKAHIEMVAERAREMPAGPMRAVLGELVVHCRDILLGDISRIIAYRKAVSEIGRRLSAAPRPRGGARRMCCGMGITSSFWKRQWTAASVTPVPGNCCTAWPASSGPRWRHPRLDRSGTCGAAPAHPGPPTRDTPADSGSCTRTHRHHPPDTETATHSRESGTGSPDPHAGDRTAAGTVRTAHRSRPARHRHVRRRRRRADVRLAARRHRAMVYLRTTHRRRRPAIRRRWRSRSPTPVITSTAASSCPPTPGRATPRSRVVRRAPNGTWRWQPISAAGPGSSPLTNPPPDFADARDGLPRTHLHRMQPNLTSTVTSTTKDR